MDYKDGCVYLSPEEEKLSGWRSPVSPEVLDTFVADLIHRSGVQFDNANRVNREIFGVDVHAERTSVISPLGFRLYFLAESVIKATE